MVDACSLHTDDALGLEYRIYIRHAVGDQEGALRRPRHPDPHYHRLSHHPVRTQMVGIWT
jgi:hypothetical protein